ncbi:hypothetical protein CRYUN_Cryun18bG0128500 [Craigia yunnanensis]
MGRIRNLVHELKPPLLMVLVRVIFAGVNVMYKLAANDGMNLRIIIAYRFMFATVIMVPLALILERMEKLAIGTLVGKVKVLGTLIGIGGAMVFTFYKGIEINIWSTDVNLVHHHQQSGGPTGPSSHGTGKFILGAFLGLLCCISFSLWLITQAKMSVKFPYLYSSTALMCIMGSVKCSVIALCTEKNWSQWKLGWNVRLLAVAFTGILGSALMVFLVSWGVHLRGPLYASIFNPLGLVFVAIVASLLLDEKLHLGSIIGGILIVCGLYIMLWGKAKEIKQKTQLVPTTTVDKEHEGTTEEELDDQTEINGKEEAVPHITVLP